MRYTLIALIASSATTTYAAPIPQLGDLLGGLLGGGGGGENGGGLGGLIRGALGNGNVRGFLGDAANNLIGGEAGGIQDQVGNFVGDLIKGNGDDEAAAGADDAAAAADNNAGAANNNNAAAEADAEADEEAAAAAPPQNNGGGGGGIPLVGALFDAIRNPGLTAARLRVVGGLRETENGLEDLADIAEEENDAALAAIVETASEETDKARAGVGRIGGAILRGDAPQVADQQAVADGILAAEEEINKLSGVANANPDFQEKVDETIEGLERLKSGAEGVLEASGLELDAQGNIVQANRRRSVKFRF